MKLIVTGATGYVGSEVVRLALRHPAISSVVALARKPVPFPHDIGADVEPSKLRSITLDDWTSPYPENVKEQLKDADACIWTLAIVPAQARSMDLADVTKVCFDYTINGITNMAAVASRPFRFIYTSGVVAQRDQEKPPPMMQDYALMRGRVETAVLKFAAQNKNNGHAVEVGVTKPGGIETPGRGKVVSDEMKQLLAQLGHAPTIHVSELAAAMIDQSLNGITKDPLWSEDMIEIGQRILRKEDYLN